MRLPAIFIICYFWRNLRNGKVGNAGLSKGGELYIRLQLKE